MPIKQQREKDARRQLAREKKQQTRELPMDDLLKFMTNTLNQALDAGESSYKGSFLLEETKDGFNFVLRYPSSLVMDKTLYYRIYDILSTAIYPWYTMIRPASTQKVIRDTNDITVGRAFFYPWKKGTYKRIEAPLSSIVSSVKKTGRIPLMHGMSFDYTKAVHLAIAGGTGSGKSYFTKTLLAIYQEIGEVILIDPKVSDGARLMRGNDAVTVVKRNRTERKEDFLPRVTEVLAGVVNELYDRQNRLYEESTKVSTDYRELEVKPIFVVIDELAALSSGLKKSLLDDFSTFITDIALLGREAGIQLVLIAQDFRADIFPGFAQVRNQIGTRIQLGRLSRETLQFLFPEITTDFDLPIGGKGSGVVSILDGESFGITPIQTPTIIEKEDL